MSPAAFLVAAWAVYKYFSNRPRPPDWPVVFETALKTLSGAVYGVGRAVWDFFTTPVWIVLGIFAVLLFILSQVVFHFLVKASTVNAITNFILFALFVGYMCAKACLEAIRNAGDQHELSNFETAIVGILGGACGGAVVGGFGIVLWHWARLDLEFWSLFGAVVGAVVAQNITLYAPGVVPAECFLTQEQEAQKNRQARTERIFARIGIGVGLAGLIIPSMLAATQTEQDKEVEAAFQKAGLGRSGGNETGQLALVGGFLAAWAGWSMARATRLTVESAQARPRHFNELDVIQDEVSWVGVDSTVVDVYRVGDKKALTRLTSECAKVPGGLMRQIRQGQTVILCLSKAGLWFSIVAADLDTGSDARIFAIREQDAKCLLAYDAKKFRAHFS